MPFLTFENVNGGTFGTYTDNPVRSVTGLLTEKLRSLYPEAESLPSAPVCQTVRGCRVDDILSAVDVDAVRHFVEDPDIKQRTGLPDSAFTTLNHQPTTVAEKFKLVNVLHTLAIKARNGISKTDGEALPYCSKEEFTNTAFGIITNRSLKWHGELGRIPDSMIECFLSVHPDAVISADKRTATVGVVEDTLLEAFGFKNNPSWVEDLLLDAIEHFGKGVAVPACSAPPPPVDAAVQPDPVDSSKEAYPEGVQAGIDHVITWLPVDYNSLTPEEKEVCAFGFKGSKAYYGQTSANRMRKVFTAITLGMHRDYEIIDHGVPYGQHQHSVLKIIMGS
ncbi:hypothetical protein LSTR_LSTR006165 [Laodelphax striatellus]|uniref:Uncharacterized protein n=1 Tax=Laodelphax striatellus TaxID=195883 RepID=A0A482XRW4_LAOST|nr:hypothetical protein LSTR_LSTR006165 [Laodelphax striatellus]